MHIPDQWQLYNCGDYFGSSLSAQGWWDEPSQCWYIEPADRIHEDEPREFLIIGRAGVDGILWGYRKGLRGIWAHYPIENDFVLVAKSVLDLRAGYSSGRITV
jgi:hypothetical protein